MEQRELRDRAKALVLELTLDEKIGMIHGAQLFQTAGVERLGIPPLKMSDGPMGVRQEFQPSSWQTIGYSDDFVTYLPCNSALASTWNRELAQKTGEVLGEEARGRGKDVILGPGINIKRSPLCGRNFEYFSEDPYLTKELAAPYIQGVQKWDVAACVKHFAANNQETERLWVDVQVEEEALRRIYLPAFYDAVTKGASHTIMGAYNLLGGEHCCQSEFLLNEILRKEWGYEGVVISDWGAVHDTKLAAESQLDIEMSVTDQFDQYFMAEPLKEKIRSGEISEQIIDEKVIRILMLMMKLHMLGGERKAGSYNTEEHRQRALDTARESVVLLKNEDSRLPFSAKETKRLLVIGENAECVHSNGGGSAEIRALYEITPLMGIKTLLGGNAEVKYVPGYIRDQKEETAGANWQETSLENGGGQTKQSAVDSHTEADIRMKEKRAALRREAAELAGQYEQVLFIGGLNHEHDSEGNDRADMVLPYEQDLLIEALLEANPETVITFVGGSPVEMGRWIGRAKAVVWSWYAGMEGGRALAEVLFGKVNPSGKLPETFYKKHTDCSAHAVGEFPGDSKVRYTEGIFVGYRYNDTFHVEPQFCFGHGLSYTEFSYAEPELYVQAGQDSASETCSDQNLPEYEKDRKRIFVRCKVKNTGDTAGKETVQVYLAQKESTKDQPVQELKGFAKTELMPGEEKKVEIAVEGYQEGMEVRIGSSSRDIRLRIG